MVYLRDPCGILQSTKVFHSFRHTFKRRTRDAGLYEELHDVITGHANKDSVGRDYSRGSPLSGESDGTDRAAGGFVGIGLARTLNDWRNLRCTGICGATAT